MKCHAFTCTCVVALFMLAGVGIGRVTAPKPAAEPPEPPRVVETYNYDAERGDYLTQVEVYWPGGERHLRCGQAP